MNSTPRILFPLILIIITGCASPARVAALMDEGDRLRLEGDRALSRGLAAEAAASYGESFGRYAEGREMALELIADAEGNPDPVLVRSEEESVTALPELALRTAEAQNEKALLLWRKGDNQFDKGDFGAALYAYRDAYAAYQSERRWLETAREGVTPLSGDADRVVIRAWDSELEGDLDQVSRDIDAVRKNIDEAVLRMCADHPDVGQAIVNGLEAVGDGLLVFLDASLVVLEGIGTVLLYTIAHPVFWEFCFELVLAICRFHH